MELGLFLINEKVSKPSKEWGEEEKGMKKRTEVCSVHVIASRGMQ